MYIYDIVGVILSLQQSTNLLFIIDPSLEFPNLHNYSTSSYIVLYMHSVLCQTQKVKTNLKGVASSFICYYSKLINNLQKTTPVEYMHMNTRNT